MKNRKIGIMGLGICLLLAGCSFGENKNKGGDPSTPQPTATEASSKVTTNTTETKKVTEKPTEATMSNEQSVSIVSHSVVKDKTGSEVLLIEYSWTNNSTKETSFMVACRDSVYQNGIECPSYSAMLDEVDSTQQMADIKPGATLNLKIGYTLQDNTNALVEVMDILGKDYYLKETIELGGGEGKTSNEPSVTAETTTMPAVEEINKELAAAEPAKPQGKMVTLTERDIPITRPENLRHTPEEIALLKKQANEAYLKWAELELEIAKYTLEQASSK